MSGEPEPSTAGRLLVATPLLADPNFHRTVVLMLEHTTMGAVGVVLNRPGDVVVDEVLPGWARLCPDGSAPVFVGGPVDPQALLAVARSDRDDTGWPSLAERVHIVDLAADPSDLPGDDIAVQVFAGYAGWGPDQLELELEEGAWWVFDADAADVAAADADGLWAGVIARQRGSVAWLSNYPDDPSLN